MAGRITDTKERVRLFEDLVRTHERRIFGMAYRLTGSHDDAEDLVQQSVIEALRYFDGFQIGTRFDRWMQRIITNNFIDRHRAQSRVVMESLDRTIGYDGEDAGPLEIPDRSGDPGYRLEQEAFEEPVQAALDALPPEYRAAVVLCDVEGYSYEDAAAALHVPVGTIRSRLSRGRGLLKRALAPYARERYGL